MTNADIVRGEIDHKQMSRIPHALNSEGDVADRLDAHYGNAEWRESINGFIAKTAAVSSLDFKPCGPEGYGRGPYGSLWRTDRRPFHLDTPVLSEPSFSGYRWPQPETFFVDEKSTEAARDLCARLKDEQYLLAGVGWGLFERSWGMRGFNEVLMDMIDEPGFYSDMLDRLTEQFIAFVHHTCRVLPHIDAIMFGDDWGEQRGVIMGPDRWREFFKPRYQRIYDTAHSYGKKVVTHCCGSIVDIMPDLIEIGLDVLESVQPEARGMSPYELKRKWGDKITFWGGLGSQSIIPFGTPAEIRAEVARLKREMGKGGGYILAPAKALQPETPTENAAAVVEAFAADRGL